MLSRPQRFPLRNHAEFFHTAQKKRFPWGTIFFVERPTPPFQAAVVVKKTIGKAALRVKEKRHIREALREFSRTGVGGTFVVLASRLPHQNDWENFRRRVLDGLYSCIRK